MRKNILILLSVFIYVFFIIGCATTTGSNESWRSLNSADELIGRWEGSAIAIIPENKENLIPQSSINMAVTLLYLKGAKNLDVTYKLDLDRMISDMIKTDAMRQAKITKDQLWGILLNEIRKADESNAFSDYGKYYLIVSEKPGTDKLSNCYINDRGNRIRIIFPEILTFGLGDTGISEVTLTKK